MYQIVAPMIVHTKNIDGLESAQVPTEPSQLPPPSGVEAWLSVTTEFFLISCDCNQVPEWFGTLYNLEVPL